MAAWHYGVFTYPFWATSPRSLRVWIFIAVVSAFFHTGGLCTLFASMFHAFKSSVTVSLHVLWGLPLLFKPSFSKWMHLFIHLSLSTCPNHVRWFNLRFDSKGERFNHPNVVDRLTLSSAFIFSIRHNITHLLCKRHFTSSLHRGQQFLAWSKVSLSQLSYNFRHVAKEIVVLLFEQLLVVHNHFQDRFWHQDHKTASLHQAVCVPKLHTFQVYITSVYKAPYIYTWDQFSIYL